MTVPQVDQRAFNYLLFSAAVETKIIHTPRPAREANSSRMRPRGLVIVAPRLENSLQGKGWAAGGASPSLVRQDNRDFPHA
ncbi:hypothetical protein ILYODFUR_029874 [Ilyodon furcidens]|uniref:Uncharacterized protein n=1 Tax=Ilyodon furcidens TaxID=33524 RepID=A0ABV0TEM8_9TELE